MKKTLPVILAVIGLIAGFWFARQQTSTPPLEISGFAFPAPKQLSDIELVDQNNQPFDESLFKDKWTFIYVGYTFCPDACPMTMTILDQLYRTLEEDNQLTDDIAMMLVSVDPHRDTPDRLNSYVSHFNERFVGATGQREQLKSFADQVSAIYSVPEDKEDPNYLVDHSSSIILIDPNAAVHAIFTPPQQAENLAKDFVVLRKRYS